MAAPLYMDGGPMSLQALIDSLQGRRRYPIDDPLAGYQPATDPDAKPPPYAPPQFMPAPRPGRTPQGMIDEAERAKQQFQPVKPNIPEQIGDIVAKTGQVGKAVVTAPVNMVRGLYDKVAAQQAAERSPSTSSDVYADPRAMAKDPEVPATALGLMGAGVPFAKPGTMGISGGKLVSSMAERNAALAKGAPLTKEQHALVSQFIGDDPYGNSLTVNPNLRAGTPLDPKAQSMADAMDAALASAPRSTAETTLYRGAPAQYKGGHEPAFLSTTKDKGVAEEFADNLPEGGAVHKVIVPKGTPLLETHPFQDEGMRYQKEVILPRKGSLSPTGNAGEFRYSPPAAASAEPVAPFYSAVEQALANAKLEKAPLDQWHNYLKGQPGVKAEELNQLGLTPGALPNQSMSKAQLQEHLDANRVQLKEVTKGGTPDYSKLPSEERDQVLREFRDFTGFSPEEFRREYRTPAAREEAAAQWYSEYAGEGQQGTPKFASYQLPGATNYGETLLTLPTQPSTSFESYLAGYRKNFPNSNADDSMIREYWAKGHGLPEGPGRTTGKADPAVYKSSHWDEPNVLAHVRHNDRQVPSPSGEGMVPSLHLEEVQSDWHQAGRKQGYKSNAITDQEARRIEEKSGYGANTGTLDKTIDSALQEGRLTSKEASDWKEWDRSRRAGVPDAPFKDTWPDLALKRMLHKAATETNPDGSFKYHAMSWTPGEAQAARYDLSKQVDGILAVKNQDGSFNLHAKMLGRSVYNTDLGKSISSEKLPDYVGKDLAEKIVNQQGSLANNNKNHHIYEGVDLKVGGEGMKTFYDKMLVDKANALGKRYGARVGQSDIPVTKLNEPHVGEGDFPFEIRRPDGSIYNRTRTREIAQGEINDHPGFTLHVDNDLLKKRTNGQKVHVLPITPELRAAAAKGFPLFALGAVAGPALAQRQLPSMDDRAAKALATKPPDVGLGR